MSSVWPLYQALLKLTVTLESKPYGRYRIILLGG